MKKMKRVFCGALAGVMLLALAACGTTDGNSANSSPNPSASTPADGGSTGGTSTPAAEEDYEEPSGGGSDNGGNSNGGSGGSSEPSYSESTGNAIVDRAYSCLGAAYVWGACSPGAFDCSGLVSYCLTGSYSRIGTSSTFLGWPRVSNPQPGDVCAGVGHCGIYIGNGQMIHAATEGVGVIIGPVQSGMVYVRA